MRSLHSCHHSNVRDSSSHSSTSLGYLLVSSRVNKISRRQLRHKRWTFCKHFNDMLPAALLKTLLRNGLDHLTTFNSLRPNLGTNPRWSEQRVSSESGSLVWSFSPNSCAAFRRVSARRSCFSWCVLSNFGAASSNWSLLAISLDLHSSESRRRVDLRCCCRRGRGARTRGCAQSCVAQQGRLLPHATRQTINHEYDANVHPILEATCKHRVPKVSPTWKPTPQVRPPLLRALPSSRNSCAVLRKCHNRLHLDFRTQLWIQVVMLSAVRHLSTDPHVSTNTHRGLATPIAYESRNNHRLLNPSLITDLAIRRQICAMLGVVPSGPDFSTTSLLRARLQRLCVSGGNDESVYVPGLNQRIRHPGARIRSSLKSCRRGVTAKDLHSCTRRSTCFSNVLPWSVCV